MNSVAQKHRRGTHHCTCIYHIRSWSSVCIFLQTKWIQQRCPSRSLATGGGMWQINISWINNLLIPSLTSEGPCPALGVAAGTHRHRRDTERRSNAWMLCSAALKKKTQRCFLDLEFRGWVWGPQGHRQQTLGASSKYFPKTKPGGTTSWLFNCTSVLMAGKGLPFAVFIPVQSLRSKC